MSARDEHSLGLASAVRDLTDEEFLQALEYGRMAGIAQAFRDAEATVAHVAAAEAFEPAQREVVLSY